MQYKSILVQFGLYAPLFGVGSLIEKSGIMTAKSWQELYQRGLAEMFESYLPFVGGSTHAGSLVLPLPGMCLLITGKLRVVWSIGEKTFL
jgi:hypothetical protein